MIQITELRKDFDGAEVLQGISFTVPTGAIFGFIGPNGAGKTTTLKILGTLIKPSSGAARIMDVDVSRHPDEVRRIVGWMPDQYGVYADLKVWEYLDFFAAAYRLPKLRRMDVIETVLGLVDLNEKRDSLLGVLSRGMTQRLCLARALLHEPKVLLLDEPASGLDPQARVELRELFKELQRMGKTILVSSHILAELSEYCSGVAIIQGGRIALAGGLDEVSAATEEGRRRVRMRIISEPQKAVEALGARSEVKSVEAIAENGLELELEISGDSATLADLLAFLVAEKIRISSFQEVGADLSDVFMKITRRET